MTLPNVIFDCDGTLVDSEILAMRVAGEIILQETARQTNQALPDIHSFIEEFAGWHFDKMMTHYEEKYGVKFDQSAMIARKDIETVDLLSSSVEPIDGINDVMEMLSAKGVNYALATSSEFFRVLPCLKRTGLDKYFTEANAFSAHDTLVKAFGKSSPKPSPAIVQFTLDKMSMDPGYTVGVEDSPTGVKAFFNAGIPVIGFTGATHIPMARKEKAAETLRAAGAFAVIAHMGELPAVLEAFTPSVSRRPIAGPALSLKG